jgi:hypothetical protein
MARPPVQEPVLVNDDNIHGQTYEHPAFAQISVSRVSGQSVLYDSDFLHHSTMCIRIHHSKLHRSLGRDWHYGHDEFLEVELSEAQWCTFVSSPNMGSGVPCTLRHLNRERMPELPRPKSRVDQFSKEQDDKVQKAIDSLNGIIETIEGTKLSQKDKGSLKSRIDQVRSELTSNRQFMAEQFDRHMEKTEERAKTEINAYHTQMVSHLGMQALGHKNSPLYDPIAKIGHVSPSDEGDDK